MNMNKNRRLGSLTVLPKPENQRQVCWSCGQKQEMCLCDHIQKFHTISHFVFLVHPKEFKKERIGTGRMTHSSLPNSSFLMGIDFSHDERVNQFIQNPLYRCFVLWPGSGSLPVEQVTTSELDQDKKIVIFILDGTWAFAKKMYQLSRNLYDLAKISIQPTAMSLFVIKQQPEKLCLSTMEAVLYILKGLELAKVESPQNWDLILAPFKKMVERQIEISQDPNRTSYRSKKAYDLDAIRNRAERGTRKRKIF